MVKVDDIYIYIKELANENLAESWDNVGLLLGDRNKNVEKIMLCLDVTTSVVKEAIENNIDLIVSHHPLIFKSIKDLEYGYFKNDIIRDLIKSDIAVISVHTNLDSAKLGLNYYLAKNLLLENLSVLVPNKSYPDEGLGRIGMLREGMLLDDFINFTKERLNINFVRLVRSNNKKIKKVAILGGSGASFINNLPQDIDIYLTGDVGYHEAIDALECNINILDIGHYAEKISKNLLKEYLENLEISPNYEILLSNSERDPFELI
ncbi:MULTISPECIES: Nif3-like dinuclear metal center hexameric protein [unclassified Gemella]|uniref:Nif3-like dinuclear metal center hexameric protein n=1 Tax=unclassified Gemella TaxID=2624949 RepID=UPI00107342B4|nr:MULTISPECIES: Nif3-like dinuclear metal center hexameric protein [unclassified Gemella]MBF0710162.1 Nif3-like dinuclear metal center hexameric protein [Gemella sp. GL1.1]MBF0746241.1 Nif3-like dinuclear metal center hexameric protein [Gemella sp. 19428wG2_WT2a]NYS27506.1 Nif3-like dinuclear metal center hexameric protein [Gemella sp. GL1]TFU60523.1 Nif3-like dinuclear metal center hexameric protein [Gemella sp. WT2a]